MQIDETELEKILSEKSNIIHPGNGFSFPQKGEYVKIKLKLYDSNNNIIFDSESTKKKYMDIRYKMVDSNAFTLLDILIGKMSLFEKMQLSLDISDIELIDSSYIINLIKEHEKITFEIEIKRAKYPTRIKFE